MRLNDLTGRRFGRLLVKERAPNKGPYTRWVCLCDCGQSRHVTSKSLLRGFVRSCGCLQRELQSRRATMHGRSRTPEYGIWRGMIDRCYNPRRNSYPNYGGRGIGVCARWLDSFQNFYADMGARPSPAHSLDRVDCNAHYEPGNVRWATKEEQAVNRRGTIRFYHAGYSLTLSEWSRQTGIPISTLHWRIGKGWPVEIALTQPVRGHRKATSLQPHHGAGR